MTIGETADVLAVSRATVYRLLDEGELTPIRVRSHTRISADDVRVFISGRRAEAGKPTVSDRPILGRELAPEMREPGLCRTQGSRGDDRGDRSRANGGQ